MLVSYLGLKGHPWLERAPCRDPRAAVTSNNNPVIARAKAQELLFAAPGRAPRCVPGGAKLLQR